MKLPGMKISLLDKQEAVGGTLGYIFDSGYDVSGLRRVHIEQGQYESNKRYYPSLIKRIFLEFNKPADSNLDTK